MTDLGLYFHIPFCIKKCKYCAFYSRTADAELMERYFDALLIQIKKAAELSYGRAITTVYFGGGTPTYFGAERIARLTEKLYECFDMRSVEEITVEANPATVNSDELKRLSGVANRLSLGLQTTDDRLLSVIGRAHTYKDFTDAYGNAVKAGFKNISVDLMFALPLQTLDGVKTDLDRVLALNPQHISLYNLTLEEGTPLFRQRAEYTFADEDEEERMYELICLRLRESGYSHYEISNFSLPGYEAKHNNMYWHRGEYIGLGAAAHSYYAGKRFNSVYDIEDFIEYAHDYDFFTPTDFYNAPLITREEADTERIMLGLRLKEGIRYPNDTRLTALVENGYAVYDESNGILSLTEKGMRVSNTIISNLC